MEDGDPDTRGQQLYAFITGGIYALLAVAGLLLGLVGSFQYSHELGPLPAAAIALALLNFGGFWLAGWAMGGKLAALIPAAMWLVMVLPLATQRSEGDLIISGSVPGQIFLFGGVVGAALAVGLTRSKRSWLLAGAPAAMTSR